MTRRTFLDRFGGAAAASLLAPSPLSGGAAKRRFTLDLVCFMIGVEARTQAEVNAFAHRHRFESVEARAEEIARMPDDALSRLRDDLRAKGLAWGAAFLPNAARPDAPTHADALASLPRLAAGLARAGITRIGTWISPASDTRTYRQNFAHHVERVGAIARILGEHGVRLGLEYVGTPTARRKRRYAFIHSLAELRELIDAVGQRDVGLVLDSWHWYTAGEGESELQSIRAEEIVAVDLNDAPSGVAVDDQIDGKRELPGATGVIDLRTFVTGLVRLGYDGPARAEPFNDALNTLGDDEACAMTIAALRGTASLTA